MESISSFDQALLTDKELINTSSGIYPRTLTNARFLEVFAKRLFWQLWVWDRALAGFPGAKTQIVLAFQCL